MSGRADVRRSSARRPSVGEVTRQILLEGSPVARLDGLLRSEGLLGFLGELAQPLVVGRSEEHTSELQSQSNLVCRLLLEKKKQTSTPRPSRTQHTPASIHRSPTWPEAVTMRHLESLATLAPHTRGAAVCLARHPSASRAQ